jgi:hypothetical protein
MSSEVFEDRGGRSTKAIVSIRPNPENNPTTNFIGDKLADQMLFWELNLPANLESESHFPHKDKAFFV